MKITILYALVVVLIGTVIPSAQAGEEPLKNLKERFSYAFGFQIGDDIAQMKDKLDAALFMRGIQDRITGKEALMNPAEIVAAKEEFQKGMREEILKENQDLAAKNKSAAEAFLATNKTRKAVKTTASGLQYEVLIPGKGPKPDASSKVKVHYQGTLLDGTVFDSSYQRKEPVSFALNQVIAGWTEGLQLMSVGAKYRLFIPANLAYGRRGAPPKIGGDAALIFEVELLEIMGKK